MFGLLKRFFSKPAAPVQPSTPTTTPQPATPPVPAQSAPHSPPAGTAAAGPPEGVITLPLAPLLASLPPNLAALAASPGSGTFSLPVKTALAQLASGAVRIAFGELRQGSPPGTFYDNATQDGSLVSLPLPQILAAMDPALLARRPAQKRVAVPESVTSVFGRGRALQAPIAAAPQPVPPAAPVSVLKPAAPAPGASHFTRPPVPGPLPSLTAKVHAPAPAAISSPVPPVAEKEVVAVALCAISESWPPPVLQAIAEFQLQSATVSLPMGRLEPGLKTGRVVFTWGELCRWLQPPPPESSSANREVALELPLKVVAPLFLARRRPRAAPGKLTGAVNIPEPIPILFSRAAGAPATAATAPAAAPGSALGEIFGLPDRVEWTPAEICRRICALEGVAGSALAMGDGLVVAAQLPAGLKGETVAAFLPQIFGRVSQSAGEMQLGPLSSVVLAAGQGRCAIYKTGKLYLAALGHPGAALPEAMLGRIAAEIAKRNP
jgi:predicted regulator of Ras-like GTPase activity (Roadblock/LC7/MglB family)